MGNQRGFTLMEVVVVMGVIGLLAAVALPGMQVARDRNRVITGADLLAAQFRQARLAAISRGAAFMVKFDCPDPGAVRVLVFTGNPAVDNAADRCSLNQENDNPPIYLPQGVSYGDGTPPSFRVNRRGSFWVLGGGVMPFSLSVSYGSHSRTLVITESGYVRTPTS